ncbi:MAG: helix-turn-helix domain-containing protein, partial [Bacteroidota bacterium]
FLNANLTLPMLAERLGMSKHRLSQLLNDNLGQSFHQYLAGYRIEAAKEILVAQPHLSVEAVGLEVGFNSRSTFFAHFKQQTGITPASFRAAKTSV